MGCDKECAEDGDVLFPGYDPEVSSKYSMAPSDTCFGVPFLHNNKVHTV